MYRTINSKHGIRHQPKSNQKVTIQAEITEEKEDHYAKQSVKLMKVCDDDIFINA